MNLFLDPAILFFVFGMFAGVVRSNLQIPEQISKFLGLYLLMALGIKGGVALSNSGFATEIVLVIGIGLFMALAIPAVSHTILKRFLNGYDSAAVAATYGSVSAVTFVTASQYLTTAGIEYNGVMAAVMALMESPAIIMAVALAAVYRASHTVTLSEVLHKSFTDGAHLLLLAALLIGYVTGDAGMTVMKPFTGDLFKGMLAFFLLDMGLKVAERIPDLRGKSPWLLAYAIVAPLTHSLAALAICSLLGVDLGDTILLMVLAASASYIAVPAVVRHSIPEANPSVYFGLSLGVTFPFNILVGIPLYTHLASM